jgi:hypothetical protein
MRPLRLVLFLALLAVGPAQAATKQEKIHELIEVTGVAEQMEKALDQIWPMIIQRGREANPDIPKEIWDRVHDIGREEFSRSLPDVLAQFEKIYDVNFSEEEIEAVLTFYKTPLGNSVMHKLNAIAPQTAALGQAWGAQVSKRVLGRMAEELHKKGYDMHL